MKNQISKKLCAFIIMVMMFSASVNAQSGSASANSQSQKQMQSSTAETAYLPNCHCTIWGGSTGCGTNSACKMYCAWYCRHHVQINIDENNSTTVAFYTEESGNVSIKIYDLTGRLVTTLIDNSFEGGEHSIAWNSKDENGDKLIPGIYSLKMTAGKDSEAEKLIVM